MKNLPDTCLLLLMALILPSLSGCGLSEQKAVAEFYDINPPGLTSEMEFSFSPRLREGYYDIDLIIRYNPKLDLVTLPFRIEYYNSSEQEVEYLTDIVDFSNAAFSKKGNFGLLEIEKTLLHDIFIDDGFYLTISPTENLTKGIISIGLSYQPVQFNFKENESNHL